MSDRTEQPPGLLLDETTFVADAAVVMRVYALHDRQPRLRTEIRAFYGMLESSEQGYRVSLHTGGHHGR